MDTDEMYRRGMADAERDEINSFYYEHYYPYRRGYDDMRRRLRRPGVIVRGWRIAPIWLALVGIVLVAAGWWYANGGQALLQPTPTALTLVATPTRTTIPTRTPIFPTQTPTATATPQPTGLRIGARARVQIDGLRARSEPALDAPIVVRFRKDAEVVITAGPREANGYTWWKIKNDAGEGWSAERSTEGQIWLVALD